MAGYVGISGPLFSLPDLLGASFWCLLSWGFWSYVSFVGFVIAIAARMLLVSKSRTSDFNVKPITLTFWGDSVILVVSMSLLLIFKVEVPLLSVLALGSLFGVSIGALSFFRSK